MFIYMKKKGFCDRSAYTKGHVIHKFTYYLQGFLSFLLYQREVFDPHIRLLHRLFHLETCTELQRMCVIQWLEDLSSSYSS